MSKQLQFLEARRVCEWCDGDIPSTARADSVTCSKSCRQARHRFRVTPAADVAASPMRFGFADPPYPGLSARYYDEHPMFAGEVDHPELVARLVADFPDGWALCTSKQALRDVWMLCPSGTRLSIFHKGERPNVSMRERNAYEAVLLCGGRKRRMEPSETLSDVLSWGGRQHSHPGALVGMKPAAFSEWVFRQLGAMRGDAIEDLFPGSGAVARAWRIYSGEPVTASTGDAWNPPRVLERRSTKESRLSESTRKKS